MPEVARYQSWESFSEQDGEAFMQGQNALQPGVPGRWFQFAIEHEESGRLAGDCALKINEQENHEAEIGFTLSPEYQGKGFAVEAVCCMLDYAFAQLGLHRVIAITDCRNSRAVTVLERLGFRREGHFLQNVWFKGAWGDEFLYAVLAEDWLNLRRARSEGRLENFSH
jgi:RimJ/RimL family protein N-acetyltransferase